MNAIKKIIYNHIVPIFGGLLVDKTIIPIIYYHNIVEKGAGFSYMHTELSVFENHMKYLDKNGYKTYTFDEIPEGFKKMKGEKEVLITFDDGFLSNYLIVFRLMKSLNLKFNIFLTADYVDKNMTDYLTWNMVKEMAESGLVGFGAHTFSHIDARKINENNYLQEITLTNRLIKRYTGSDVNDFCFPYGYYDKSIMNSLCSKKTYKRLYTSDHMRIRKNNNCEIIGRIPISNDYNVTDFEKHIHGKYNIMYYYSYIRGSYTKK
jgi:peptidoglycan/xylan/chitin deacetylase (PgdA/CDA1 family)